MKNLSIALFEPEIPQNAGTIIRLSSALDLTLYILHPCGFIWDGNNQLKRAGMDYIDQAKIVHLDNFSALKVLGKRIVATVCMSVTDYRDFSFQSNDIILFGRESDGLPGDVMDMCDEKITIPMHGKARSLNLSVSVGMIVAAASIGLK